MRREPAEDAAEDADGGWVVRPVTGAATTKLYRCPGCDHHIPLGTPHRVVWPVGAVDERRHWHTPCWTRLRGQVDRRRRWAGDGHRAGG